MDVATRVIEKFGGARALAKVLGCDPSRVYRWTYSSKRGGTGGLIPQRQHKKLLKVAKKLGINLRYSDLVPQDEPVRVRVAVTPLDRQPQGV